MKTARVNINNLVQQVSVNDDYSIVTADGRTYREDEITWLPPQHGTVFALGLNYADHASELAFKAPEQPLLFLKTPITFTGHRQRSYRPDSVEYMHYEAELVAVIGKTGPQGEAGRSHGLRGRLHPVQRLRGTGLPGKLLPAQPAGQVPGFPVPPGDRTSSIAMI